MKLKKYLKAINHEVNGGEVYHWECFGRNARFLDSTVSSCIYDCLTQKVYSITIDNDGDTSPKFMWIDKAYRDLYIAESNKRGFDPFGAYDDEKYTEVSKNSMLSLLDAFKRVSGIHSDDENALAEQSLAEQSLDELITNICSTADSYNTDETNDDKKAESSTCDCSNKCSACSKSANPDNVTHYNIPILAVICYDVAAEDLDSAQTLAMTDFVEVCKKEINTKKLIHEFQFSTNIPYIIDIARKQYSENQ